MGFGVLEKFQDVRDGSIIISECDKFKGVSLHMLGGRSYIMLENCHNVDLQECVAMMQTTHSESDGMSGCKRKIKDSSSRTTMMHSHDDAHFALYLKNCSNVRIRGWTFGQCGILVEDCRDVQVCDCMFSGGNVVEVTGQLEGEFSLTNPQKP